MACAVTEMTPTQLAGALNTKSPSLPVGATTTMLLATAKLMIPCSVDGHVSPRTPPKFRLMICGRFAAGFRRNAGNRLSDRPRLHQQYRTWSHRTYPARAPAECGRHRTDAGNRPNVAASVLLAVAAMIPAVCEPCQLLVRVAGYAVIALVGKRGLFPRCHQVARIGWIVIAAGIAVVIFDKARRQTGAPAFAETKS